MEGIMANHMHSSAEKSQARERSPVRPEGQLDESASSPAALLHDRGATPDALSPAHVLIWQRVVGNRRVRTILARRAPSAAVTGRMGEAGRLTVSRQETPPAGTAPPEEAPAEVPLTKKGMADFFKSQFEADFKGKGLGQYFSLVLASFKKVQTPPKGAEIQTTAQQCWEQLSTAIKGLTTDTRNFRKDLVLQVSDEEKPQYLKMQVALNRPPVTASEQPGIEKTLVEVDTAHAYGSKKGLKLAEKAYKAYQQLYKAAEAAGLMKEIPDLFKIVSDYRSVTEQQGIWKQKCEALAKSHPDWNQAQIEQEARQWVAKPGGSAHHTGYAMDLNMGWSIGSANAKKMHDKKSDLYKKFGKYWEWMKENGPKYGLLPYASEPWHWEAWLA
jgi:LAS superfamily LD-carboxypeptidase LdcB